MTTTYSPSIVGSSHPLAGATQSLAVIPTNSNAYVNINIANTSPDTTDRVRVSVKRSGQAFDNSCYVCFDTPIPPEGLFQIPNIGLGPQDQVFVYSELGVCSFNVLGNTFSNF